MAHNTLGSVLQKMGLVSEAQLNRALAEQKNTGELLGKTLVKLGLITEDELVKSLSKQLGIQELLGHKDVSMTMIYTHVLNRGGMGVRNPVDALWHYTGLRWCIVVDCKFCSVCKFQ